MSERIKLSHGGGGRLMHRLIREVFVSRFDGAAEAVLDDAAEIAPGPGRCAFTTDSFVVQPLFFPGGDIGRLAVCGTVNDLAAKGARAGWLSAAFVIEEGLPRETLERVADSMARAAQEAGARIVTGDTKVVERGKADGLFITTAGVGRIIEGVNVSGAHARPGDCVLVSGTIGDHGAAVMNARQRLGLRGALESDCAPLGELVGRALEAVPETRVLRDPTRGGLATALLEVAGQSGVGIVIEEQKIPVRRAVREACEVLGLDPLYVANEGKMLAVAPGPAAEVLLDALRSHPLGREAAVIGRVEKDKPGLVLETAAGGRRPLIMLEGDPLPRIC